MNSMKFPSLLVEKEIKTGNLGKCLKPHDHQHVLAEYHKASEKEVNLAIKSSLKAWKSWSEMPLQERTSIFRKAAKLLIGPWRDILNASTMLNQKQKCFPSRN